MKKVLCNNSELPRVFAHILDDGTIDVVRQDQRFTVIGKDFTLIGTNPQGGGKTVLMVKDGKLVEDDIKFKEDEVPPVTPPTPEGDPAPTPVVEPEATPPVVEPKPNEEEK